MSRRYARVHPCPTITKRGYGTREEAEGELPLFAAVAALGATVPLRVYHCPCGKYHLTSKAVRGGVGR